ncbi:MAG TPA: glycerophosphodiester phosphodiesterase family protein [Blastocatellia bacterium]|nr:glycerophosphodiester phosphodiesterase family protein [Blastocatellia bacterium]
MKIYIYRLTMAAAICGAVILVFAQSGRKILIAHRGASAYAPEHTVEAYRLAIEQGADFVEQDLQVTKDGELVCLHDLTLERTTDVEEVFPDRFRADVSKDQPSGVQTAKQGPVKRWYVSDFTLSEIKRLDAGSWFNAKFKGARVQTFQEAIDLIRGKAGLYPETKAPEVYGNRGFDMEKLVLETLKKNRLDTPGADPKTPVIIQSFSPESLRKMRFDLKTKLPLTLLITGDTQNEWLSAGGMKRVKEFADGVGPAKGLVERNPEIVRWAHDVGLTVTPWTFRSASTGQYKDAREEMRHFLFDYGVDAMFTDNPDLFPRS